jgi:hypothetical protein
MLSILNTYFSHSIHACHVKVWSQVLNPSELKQKDRSITNKYISINFYEGQHKIGRSRLETYGVVHALEISFYSCLQTKDNFCTCKIDLMLMQEYKMSHYLQLHRRYNVHFTATSQEGTLHTK